MLEIIVSSAVALMILAWFICRKAGLDHDRSLQAVISIPSVILLALPIHYFFDLGYIGAYAIFVAAPLFIFFLLVAIVTILATIRHKYFIWILCAVTVYLVLVVAAFSGGAIYRHVVDSQPKIKLT